LWLYEKYKQTDNIDNKLFFGYPRKLIKHDEWFAIRKILKREYNMAVDI